jgi:hypothetical protein
MDAQRAEKKDGLAREAHDLQVHWRSRQTHFRGSALWRAPGCASRSTASRSHRRGLGAPTHTSESVGPRKWDRVSEPSRGMA